MKKTFRVNVSVFEEYRASGELIWETKNYEFDKLFTKDATVSSIAKKIGCRRKDVQQFISVIKEASNTNVFLESKKGKRVTA